MTFDIIVYETAFQGRAIEPRTPRGREWCDQYNGNCDLHPDFNPGTIQTDARDFDDFFDAMLAAGLDIGTATGGQLVKQD